MQHIGFNIDRIIAEAHKVQEAQLIDEINKQQEETTDPGNDQASDVRRQQNDEHRNYDPRTGRDTKVHRRR